MVSGERSAERPTSVAGSGLNPDIFKVAIAPDFAVGDAVERHASCETEIADSGFGCERARQPEDHFLGDRLDGSRQVRIALRYRRLRFSGRAAEQSIELCVGHP